MLPWLILLGVGLLVWFGSSSSAEASTPPAESSGGDSFGLDSPPALDASQLVADYAPSLEAVVSGDVGSSTALDVRPAAFQDAPPELAAPAEAPGMIFVGAAGQLPTAEQQTILAVAKAKGVDPAALAAIRIQENGGAGREFGVLSVIGQYWYQARVDAVGSLQAQAEVAADSLKNSEKRYRADSGQDPRGGGTRYTFAFWQYFGARWAPINAANDPRGLNRYWVDNVGALYNETTVA